jgi:hypothetical protein
VTYQDATFLHCEAIAGIGEHGDPLDCPRVPTEAFYVEGHEAIARALCREHAARDLSEHSNVWPTARLVRLSLASATESFLARCPPSVIAAAAFARQTMAADAVRPPAASADSLELQRVHELRRIADALALFVLEGVDVPSDKTRQAAALLVERVLRALP